MVTPAVERLSDVYDGLDRMLLNGRWLHGRSGHTLDDVDPYTNESLLRIPLASEQDLDEAFEAAQAAQPGWASTLPSNRAAVTRRAAEIIDARHAEIVDWLVHESGSTRVKAEWEWAFARDVTF